MERIEPQLSLSYKVITKFLSNPSYKKIQNFTSTSFPSGKYVRILDNISAYNIVLYHPSTELLTKLRHLYTGKIKYITIDDIHTEYKTNERFFIYGDENNGQFIRNIYDFLFVYDLNGEWLCEDSYEESVNSDDDYELSHAVDEDGNKTDNYDIIMTSKPKITPERLQAKINFSNDYLIFNMPDIAVKYSKNFILKRCNIIFRWISVI